MATIKPTGGIGNYRGNIDPFGRAPIRQTINQPIGRGNLAQDLYHQAVPRAAFEAKITAMESFLLNGNRIGAHNPNEVAQLISGGHYSLNSAIVEMTAVRFDPIKREFRPQCTPKELAGVISSEYMRTSDAAALLSDTRVPQDYCAKTLIELFHRPEKLATVLMSPQMSKLNLAKVIDHAVDNERVAGKPHTGHKMSRIMAEMLKTHIPASVAPEILYYVDNENAQEILQAIKDPALVDRILRETDDYAPSITSEEYSEALIYGATQRFGVLHQSPAPESHVYDKEDLLHLYTEEELSKTNKKQLLSTLVKLSRDLGVQIGTTRTPDSALTSQKLILMKNAALATRLLGPDEAADVLGRLAARRVAEEILSTGDIPLVHKARILNSKAFDMDSACWIMSEMPAHTLVDILEQREASMNPIISYDRLIGLMKSRHYLLGKAISLLSDTGFTRAGFLFGNRNKVGNVLMNVLLYYLNVEKARELIAKSGRDEEALKNCLSLIFKPDPDKPCTQ